MIEFFSSWAVAGLIAPTIAIIVLGGAGILLFLFLEKLFRGD